MNPGVLILLLVTLVWGTTFPLLKSASADLGSVEISAFRFLGNRADVVGILSELGPRKKERPA